APDQRLEDRPAEVLVAEHQRHVQIEHRIETVPLDDVDPAARSAEPFRLGENTVRVVRVVQDILEKHEIKGGGFETQRLGIAALEAQTRPSQAGPAGMLDQVDAERGSRPCCQPLRVAALAAAEVEHSLGPIQRQLEASKNRLPVRLDVPVHSGAMLATQAARAIRASSSPAPGCRRATRQLRKYHRWAASMVSAPIWNTVAIR